MNKDEEEKKVTVENNVEVKSGMNRSELEGKFLELDTILGGIELSNAKIQNINIELGRIHVDVENTDPTSLTKMGLTMMDVSHMVCLLSDLMSYVSKDLNKEVKKLSEFQSDLLEEIKKPN